MEAVCDAIFWQKFLSLPETQEKNQASLSFMEMLLFHGSPGESPSVLYDTPHSLAKSTCPPQAQGMNNSREQHLETNTYSSNVLRLMGTHSIKASYSFHTKENPTKLNK